MTTYTAHDGSKIDLDPSTVKLLEAFSLVSHTPVNQLAAAAVELLRPVLVPSTKAAKQARRPRSTQ